MAAPGDTDLVSVAMDGTGAGGFTNGMSPDARFVVFSARSANVVPGGNPESALLLKDRLLDTTRVVAGPGMSFPTVSANGRFVAFMTYSQLVALDTNDQSDIYVRDLQERRTLLASQSSNGAVADDYTDAAVISANGRYVVFESDSNRLVPGDTNLDTDIFLRDLQAGTTERVSVSAGEAQANGGSFNCSISADGRYVVFHSYASNLVAGDTNGESDVFVRDRVNGTTERVSVSSSGTQANRYSYAFAGLPSQVSPDGRYVVFVSEATNLIVNDTNDQWDIFIRDRQLGVTESVSVSTTGAQSNGMSLFGSVSADGRYVAFDSVGSNLVAGDLNGNADTFVRDRQAHTTARASVSTLGVQSNGTSYFAQISADGQQVLFNNTGSNLVEETTASGSFEVYLHEMGTSPRTTPFVVDPEQLQIDNATIWTGTTRDLTFTNTGAAAVSVTALTLSGTDASQFTAAHTCGASLAVGSACLVKVTLTPTSTGNKTAQLVVAAGGASQAIGLTGTGVVAQFTLSTTALAFGSEPAGTSSGWYFVQVRNTGLGLLPIRWVGLLGPDASQFDRRRWCPAALTPGRVCNLPVSFQPTSAGAKSARLGVSPGKSGTLKYVVLSGTGT